MTKYRLPDDAVNLEKVTLEVIRCPECGETEISDCHHEADYSTDECDFFVCTNCGYQWGME